MAWHGMDNRELVFEDAIVPAKNLLGVEGAGIETGPWGPQPWPNCFWCVVGLIQACLDESLRYAKERKQFGEPLSLSS